ncbi:hypothetical protein PIB30_086177 [Stylosanthes scabra]|uniref:Secreted protein n=1 Tax=Stylosanthes scabra TaxID=79078 RepID=A0ABU6YSJ0_9FABA|nr:hypothetical protein [Stylosanthes scabra]
MACYFLARSSALFTASMVIAASRVCLSKSSLKAASSFRMGQLRVTVFAGFFFVNWDLVLHLLLRSLALCFYPLNMRFSTDGTNVKVGSLNNCPRDFGWGAESQ